MSSTSIIAVIMFGMFSVSTLLKCKCFGDDENQLIMKLFSRLINEETNSCAPLSDRLTYWRIGIRPGVVVTLGVTQSAAGASPR